MLSISSSLSLTTLNPNLYVSQNLWTPSGARGVFGGQVIGQALNAANETLPKSRGWGLHSMHCYFILSADALVPIIYSVQRLRDGKSYATRSVEASQNGIPIFHLSCSFSLPSPTAQPKWFSPMPDLRWFFSDLQGNELENVVGRSEREWRLPTPDECEKEMRLPGPAEIELEEDRWQMYLDGQLGKVNEKAREGLKAYIAERKESPIAIKEIFPVRVPSAVPSSTDAPKSSTSTLLDLPRPRNKRMLWMKTRDDGGGREYDEGFQKCILAYISDFQFVGTAAQSVDLSHYSRPKLGMLSSLDHTVHFYSSSFRTSRWLLHVMESPITSNGRGVVWGRFYTEEGELVATCVQEGVVRAAIEGKGKEAKAKL